METLDAVPLGLADLLAVMFTLLQRGLFIAAIVLFIVWMWRAHKNLYAFPGVGPTMGAGWSIGGWFIPLANLVIPFIVMNDIARGSLAWREREPRRTGVQPLVGFWWAAYVVSVCGAVAAAITDRRDALRLPMPSRRDDFQDYVDYYASVAGRSLISTVALVVAGVLAIMLIRRISQAQTARIARAYQLGHVASAPGALPAGPAAQRGPAAPWATAAPSAPDAPADPTAPTAGSGTPT